MCFDLDSTPPIPALAGAVVERRPVELGASDGNRFRAFHAIPGEGSGNAVVILPDVRGLHHYYEELAVRLAEIGVEALSIDYFGRTAGTGPRGHDFDHAPHVAQTTWAGISADLTAAVAYLRASGSHVHSVFTLGFCMGGRAAFDSAALGLGLAGAIGFYGWPTGPSRNDTPAPIEMVERFECPVLGIFGGADEGIPMAAVHQFRDALAAVDSGRVDRSPSEIVVEPDAPHSFFDRKQAEFSAQSEDAWARVGRFIEAHGAA